MKNFQKVTSARRAVVFSIGQGEGEEEKVTLTSAELTAKISEATAAALAEAKKGFEKETLGLSKKNKELLDTLSGATEKLKKVDGVDIEALLALKQTVENDEILSLAAQGKHAEAIDKATEKMRVTHQAELDAAKTELQRLVESSSRDKQLVDKLMIDGGAKASFIQSKGLPEAIDDIAIIARQVWKVEEGELVARDASGEMIKGEKGPITMEEWVDSQKKARPYMFPASESAGLKTGKTGKVDMNDYDAQMVEAAKAGDTSRMRELREAKKKASGR